MRQMLHLGLGNFHRAHQAWHMGRAGGWEITGVVMGNAALYHALRAQAGAYNLGIRGPDGLHITRIALHKRLILARDDPQAVVAAIADPAIEIITLTITEKGYCLGPDGRLDLNNPAIAADLAKAPGSAIGLLAHGLAARRAPVTVISCDNISANGQKLRAAVDDFAQAAGLVLSADIRFPDAMVDRITPATSDAIRAEIAAISAAPDEVPVLTEAFSEWIIEDDFATARPDWGGVQLVPAVAPYEMRKLRLLNAAHSYLAYAGLLVGHRHVHAAVGDAALRAGVNRLWDEAQATLPDAVLASTQAYRAALLDRFAVAGMRHELTQIASDGSLKLRERIVPLVLVRPKAVQARRAIAAWIAFLIRSRSATEPLRDANAEAISRLLTGSPSLGALCHALAGMIGLAQVSPDWLDALAQDVADLGAQFPR